MTTSPKISMTTEEREDCTSQRPLFSRLGLPGGSPPGGGIILRSDADEDALCMVTHLKKKFVREFEMVSFPLDQNIHQIDLRPYFDEHEIQRQGSNILRWVLLRVSSINGQRFHQIRRLGWEWKLRNESLFAQTGSFTGSFLREHDLDDGDDEEILEPVASWLNGVRPYCEAEAASEKEQPMDQEACTDAAVNSLNAPLSPIPAIANTNELAPTTKTTSPPTIISEASPSIVLQLLPHSATRIPSSKSDPPVVPVSPLQQPEQHGNLQTPHWDLAQHQIGTKIPRAVTDGDVPSTKATQSDSQAIAGESKVSGYYRSANDKRGRSGSQVSGSTKAKGAQHSPFHSDSQGEPQATTGWRHDSTARGTSKRYRGNNRPVLGPNMVPMAHPFLGGDYSVAVPPMFPPGTSNAGVITPVTIPSGSFVPPGFFPYPPPFFANGLWAFAPGGFPQGPSQALPSERASPADHAENASLGQNFRAQASLNQPRGRRAPQKTFTDDARRLPPDHKPLQGQEKDSSDHGSRDSQSYPSTRQNSRSNSRRNTISSSDGGMRHNRPHRSSVSIVGPGINTPSDPAGKYPKQSGHSPGLGIAAPRRQSFGNPTETVQSSGTLLNFHGWCDDPAILKRGEVSTPINNTLGGHSNMQKHPSGPSMRSAALRPPPDTQYQSVNFRRLYVRSAIVDETIIRERMATLSGLNHIRTSTPDKGPHPGYFLATFVDEVHASMALIMLTGLMESGDPLVTGVQYSYGHIPGFHERLPQLHARQQSFHETQQALHGRRQSFPGRQQPFFDGQQHFTKSANPIGRGKGLHSAGQSRVSNDSAFPSGSVQPSQQTEQKDSATKTGMKPHKKSKKGEKTFSHDNVAEAKHSQAIEKATLKESSSRGRVSGADNGDGTSEALASTSCAPDELSTSSSYTTPTLKSGRDPLENDVQAASSRDWEQPTFASPSVAQQAHESLLRSQGASSKADSRPPSEGKLALSKEVRHFEAHLHPAQSPNIQKDADRQQAHSNHAEIDDLQISTTFESNAPASKQSGPKEARKPFAGSGPRLKRGPSKGFPAKTHPTNEILASEPDFKNLDDSNFPTLAQASRVPSNKGAPKRHTSQPAPGKLSAEQTSKKSKKPALLDTSKDTNSNQPTLADIIKSRAASNDEMKSEGAAGKDRSPSKDLPPATMSDSGSTNHTIGEEVERSPKVAKNAWPAIATVRTYGIDGHLPHPFSPAGNSEGSESDASHGATETEADTTSISDKGEGSDTTAKSIKSSRKNTAAGSKSTPAATFPSAAGPKPWTAPTRASAASIKLRPASPKGKTPPNLTIGLAPKADEKSEGGAVANVDGVIENYPAQRSDSVSRNSATPKGSVDSKENPVPEDRHAIGKHSVSLNTRAIEWPRLKSSPTAKVSGTLQESPARGQRPKSKDCAAPKDHATSEDATGFDEDFTVSLDVAPEESVVQQRSATAKEKQTDCTISEPSIVPAESSSSRQDAEPDEAAEENAGKTVETKQAPSVTYGGSEHPDESPQDDSEFKDLSALSSSRARTATNLGHGSSDDQSLVHDSNQPSSDTSAAAAPQKIGTESSQDTTSRSLVNVASSSTSTASPVMTHKKKKKKKFAASTSTLIDTLFQNEEQTSACESVKIEQEDLHISGAVLADDLQDLRDTLGAVASSIEGQYSTKNTTPDSYSFGETSESHSKQSSISNAPITPTRPKAQPRPGQGKSKKNKAKRRSKSPREDALSEVANDTPHSFLPEVGKNARSSPYSLKNPGIAENIDIGRANERPAMSEQGKGKGKASLSSLFGPLGGRSFGRNENEREPMDLDEPGGSEFDSSDEVKQIDIYSKDSGEWEGRYQRQGSTWYYDESKKNRRESDDDELDRLLDASLSAQPSSSKHDRRQGSPIILTPTTSPASATTGDSGSAKAADQTADEDSSGSETVIARFEKSPASSSFSDSWHDAREEIEGGGTPGASPGDRTQAVAGAKEPHQAILGSPREPKPASATVSLASSSNSAPKPGARPPTATELAAARGNQSKKLPIQVQTRTGSRVDTFWAYPVSDDDDDGDEGKGRGVKGG